jgi:hypothetical protein
VSFLSTLGDEGPAIRRGLITIFLVAGAVTAWRWDVNEPVLRLALGLGSLAVGIGIWLFWSWARWVALGACFLAIVTAFSTPMLLALWRPFDDFSSEPRMTELLASLVAGAFGVIGYKGLSHLRSVDARSAFELKNESSVHVLVSSLCVATLLAGAIAGRDVKLPQLSVPARSEVLPDLVVKRLCMSGINRVEAEVANQGAGPYPGVFTIGYDDLHYARYSEYSQGEVPAPGRSTYVVLTTALNPTEREGRRLVVRTFLDASSQVPESNEGNNRNEFEVIFDTHYPANLPRCPSADGDVELPEPSAAAGSAALPDLVVAGLCMTDINRLKAEVRNLGTGWYSGEYSLGFDDLQYARHSEYSQGAVPAPGQSTYVALNAAYNSTGREGHRLVVRTFLDASTRVPESNEDNNRKEFELIFDAKNPTNLPRCP